MNTLKNSNHEFSSLANNVEINKELLTVYLEDGRIISVPIAYFSKLLNATSEQRQRWRLIGKVFAGMKLMKIYQ